MSELKHKLVFKVRGKWTDRSVACRLAMCLGVGSPLAWEAGDSGAPFWHSVEQKWQVDPGNDYWLRKIDEKPVDEVSKKKGLKWPVKTFQLNYRYTTADREEALKGLCQWLECDLVFGA